VALRQRGYETIIATDGPQGSEKPEPSPAMKRREQSGDRPTATNWLNRPPSPPVRPSGGRNGEDGAGICRGFPALGIGFCYARAASGQAAEGDEQPVVLSIPAEFRRVGLGIRRLVDGQALPGQGSKADPKLVASPQQKARREQQRVTR